MRLTTLALASALALAVTSVAAHAPSPALALGVASVQAPAPFAAVAPEETPADWEKKYDRTLTNSMKEYGKLAKWCNKNHLEWTSDYVKRRGFIYLPDDGDLREYFGYEKGPDGRWMQHESAKDKFRAKVDEDDPNSGKYPKNVSKAQGKIAGWFRGLANKAQKLGDETGDAAWAPLAKRAWERVLEADPEGKYASAAHKSLDHPKYGGEYVSPFALKFLKERKARKQAGEEIAARTFEISQIPADGFIPDAGITGVGSKSTHMVINTAHDQAVSDRLAQWSERALDDIVERYGFPEAMKERLPTRKFDVLTQEAGKDGLRKYLEKGAKWPTARVTKFIEYFGGGTAAGGIRFTMSSPGVDADDGVIHQVGHAASIAAMQMALSDLGNRIGSNTGQIESWLQESVAYDCTRRLTGTTLTTCGAFGKYGQTTVAKPGQDLWILLARRQVEIDDDVPLSQLWRKGINDLRGPETVKGYALVQFLFENDSATAQKFLWHALAHGTPAAVVDVYSDWLGTPRPEEEDADTESVRQGTFSQPEYQNAMAELDERYREWLMKTYHN